MYRKDTLFNSSRHDSPFVFDEAVAAVFPDMIRRSVPGYATVIAGTGLTAGLYAQPRSNCYDLGCSLGASTFAMSQHIKHSDCQIIAVDSSEEMLKHAKENNAKQGSRINIDFICKDIRNVKLENASVVVLNYTLQFIPLEDRVSLLETIYQGMKPDGVLILSEKITFDTEAENTAQIKLHDAFKREQGYSELEISQKRAALENVLVPETLRAHTQRLCATGFRDTQSWFRCFNFASLLTWK